MKITKQQLRKIIKEEVQKLQEEREINFDVVMHDPKSSKRLRLPVKAVSKDEAKEKAAAIAAKDGKFKGYTTGQVYDTDNPSD